MAISTKNPDGTFTLGVAPVPTSSPTTPMQPSAAPPPVPTPPQQPVQQPQSPTVNVNVAQPNTPQTQPQTSQNGTTGTQAGQPMVPTTSLQPGAQGADVANLQNYLVQMGYLTPDQVASGPGNYGPQTTAAVAKMQSDLGIQAGSGAGFYGPKTQSALAQKYNGLFDSKSGTQAPDTNPRLDIQNSTQGSTNPVFGALSSSIAPIMQSLSQVLQNINNPALGAVSLQQEYNDLAQQNNLPALQTQMMNMQNVMNGTEQDVRDEVTKAGGFASESQVMGITASRNKVILKQYNAVASQYTAAQTNISNMMQYATADKQTELQRQQATAGIVESMSSIGIQMAQMGITMQNTSRQADQTAITNLGYKQFVSGFKGDQASLYAAQQLLFPGAPLGTTLTDPAWVQEADTKWQSQQSINAARLYYQAYGQLPPGFSQGGITSPSTSSDSTVAPYAGGTVIGGIDFGQTPTGIGAYATDIGSEMAGVSRGYNDIVGAFGQNPTNKQLDSYIQNNDSNSPVTGQMILTAAKQTNVSPAILTALLNNESGFGTAGVGASTMNPGNVGNTGSATKSFGSWQEGVTAAAQQLARRSVSQYANSSNPIVAQAYKLATGTMAMSQLSKRSGTYGATIAMADKISQNLTGKPFDAEQAQASYNFNASTKVQMMKTSLNFTIATLSRLKDLSHNVDRGSITYGNAAGQWLKYNGSDKNTVDFVTQANAAVDDVGAALGGGVSTDKKIAIAGKILDPTLSQEAFDSQINTDIVSVAGRLGFITSQGSLGGANATVQMEGANGTYAVPYDQVKLFTDNGYKLK